MIDLLTESTKGIMRRIRRLEALELSPGSADENILTNPGLEVWQRGAGPFIANGYSADRWTIQQFNTGVGKSISVIPEYTIVDARSAASAHLTWTDGTGDYYIYLMQHIEDGDLYDGCSLIFTARVYVVSGNITIGIRDSTGIYEYVWGNWAITVGAWEDLIIRKTIRSGSSSVSVMFLAGFGNGECYVDNAVFRLGSAGIYQPLTPTEEWNRCLRYYETGHLCYRGYSDDANGLWLPLTYVERKCRIPTVTMGGGVYAGTATDDILVPSDENSACWQIETSGAGVGSVSDRDYILEANCDPIDSILYFTPGNPDGATPGIGGELWRYDGEDLYKVFSETDTTWGENWVTCIFWSQIYNTMYFCTWDWDDARIRVYSVAQDDTVTLIYEEIIVPPPGHVTSPIVDAAEFQGQLYLIAAGFDGSGAPSPAMNYVAVFDPVAATLTHVLDMPMAAPPAAPYTYTGGLAVDVAANELVAFGGYQAWYSGNGVAWSLDYDFEPAAPVAFGSADSFSLITYGGEVYLGIQDHHTNAFSVLRRVAAGNWVNDYTGPYGPANAVTAFTCKFNPVTGADEALYAQFWGWFFAAERASIAIRTGGVWAIDWTGPDASGGDSQEGLWAQSLAQYGSDVYGLWVNRKDWDGTSLYRRDNTTGTWSLVNQFANYVPAPTYAYTLAIAASNNSFKACHEV